MATETELESKLERRFFTQVKHRLGGRIYKQAPTTKGLPDRLVLLPGGRIFLVELKTSTGQCSPAQLLVHSHMAALGTKVIVLHGQAETDRWIDNWEAELQSEKELRA